ncbi:hypothetical protein ABKN59_009692 [Abortiporus biennis]
MDSYRIPREKANRWIDEVVNSAVNEFVSHRGWIMEDAHDNSRSHLHGTLVKQIRIVIAAMLKFLIHSNNLFGRYLSAIVTRHHRGARQGKCSQSILQSYSFCHRQRSAKLWSMVADQVS